jgi:hypothetical protein
MHLHAAARSKALREREREGERSEERWRVRKRRADPVTCVDEQIKAGLLHARQIQWSSPPDPVELEEKRGFSTPPPGARARGCVELPRNHHVRELGAALGCHHRDPRC